MADRLETERKVRENGIRYQGKSHEFYGKVFCGCCGAPYQRRTKSIYSPIPGPLEYKHVWMCRERNKGSKGNGCKNRVIKDEVMNQAFLSHPGELLVVIEESIEIKQAPSS